MLEIIRVVSTNDKHKKDMFEHIKEKHSVYGEFVFPPEVGKSFFFTYYDETGQSLASSTVQNIEYIESDKLYIMTTLNSIYYIVSRP